MKPCCKIVLLLIFAVGKLIGNTDISLTASQTYMDDWKLGVRRAFDVSYLAKGKYNYQIDTLLISLNYKLAIGFLYEDSDRIEKSRVYPTVNELFIEPLFKYNIGWKVDPYLSFTLRTQVTEAVRYMQEQKIVTAKFWDPITTQQAIGLAYLLKNNTINYEVRLGVSLMQIESEKYNNITDDRSTRETIETYKSATGIEFVNNLNYQIDKKTRLQSSFSLLGDFKNPDIWIVRFENQFKIQIWKYFGILADFDIVYDQNQLMKLQILQTFKLGFVTKL